MTSDTQTEINTMLAPLLKDQPPKGLDGVLFDAQTLHRTQNTEQAHDDIVKVWKKWGHLSEKNLFERALSINLQDRAASKTDKDCDWDTAEKCGLADEMWKRATVEWNNKSLDMGEQSRIWLEKEISKGRNVIADLNLRIHSNLIWDKFWEKWLFNPETVVKMIQNHIDDPKTETQCKDLFVSPRAMSNTVWLLLANAPLSLVKEPYAHLDDIGLDIADTLDNWKAYLPGTLPMSQHDLMIWKQKHARNTRSREEIFANLSTMM